MKATADPRSLQDVVVSQAAERPNDTALWWQGRATSYRELQQRVQALAARLAACGAPGDRIGVLAWNRPEFIELMYAVPASGRVLVPLNARLAPAELDYQLEVAGVQLLFGDSQLLQALHGPQRPALHAASIDLDRDYAQWLQDGPGAPLPETCADYPAWILFTSGSTGRPRGAELSHDSLLAGLRSAAIARPVQSDDKYLYPFPLFHVAAHNVLLQHRYGAAVVLHASFDAAATLRDCRELGVTTMSLAPTMIGMLLDHPDFNADDLCTVRTIGYGASAMPLTLLERLLRETDVGLCQGYGMTELSGSAAFLTVEDHRLAASSRPELLRSVGRPLPTVEIELVDDDGDRRAPGEIGEIVVRGEQCMRGYWNDPKASARTIVDGWLHTGDMGRFDSEGYLYIIDRKKDMVITGGENVASREVEEVMRRHPAVADCAVIGVPDERWGEAICCVLRMEADADDGALSDYCRQHLAGYKVPKHWERVEALPINASGKVDKPALRRLLAGAMQGGWIGEGSNRI